MFQLYASGKYNLDTLAQTMRELGLRNSKGTFIHRSSISAILNNPFYSGVLKVKGKTFEGRHEPLVSSKIYLEVQNILNGKTNTKQIKHEFIFRRLVKCADCGYSMVGEKQKGHVYYRCHSKECDTKGIREESIEKALLRSFEQIHLHQIEFRILNELLMEAQESWSSNQKGIEESIQMQQGRISKKLERLTDAYVENAIEKSLFEEKKETLLVEMQGLRHKLSNLTNEKEAVLKKAEKFLELISSLKNSYLLAITEEKRKILKIVTSNLGMQGKKLMFTMLSPFYEIVNRTIFSSSPLECNRPRISRSECANLATSVTEPVDSPELRARMKELLDWILQYFESHQEIDEEEII
jgi:hypothetical protein